jgi:hypothetical protein
MLAPGAGLKTFSTAPAPVWRPQPKGAAISSGTSSGTFTTVLSRPTACVAKLDWAKKWACIGSPFRESTLEPSAGRDEAKLWSQKARQ